VRLFIVVNQLY